MFAILICGVSSLFVTIIDFLFPFAPACASPLNAPVIIMFSPAIISAPPFTSPITIMLPSYSSFCPDLREPL